MLAPPLGGSFDDNEDEKQLPTSRSPLGNNNRAVEENTVVSNKPSIDSNSAPESEPLLNLSDETLTANLSTKRVRYHLILDLLSLIHQTIEI
jgi:hypothetical protein